MKQSQTWKHILRIGAWSTVLAIGLTAQAAEFYQSVDMAIGTHWNEAFWTNATQTTAIVPSADNTYVNDVGGTRTPTTGEDFLGDLLTIKSERQLQLKHAGGSSVSVNLVMENGSTMKNGGSTGLLEGTLNGSGIITLDTTTELNRDFIIGSLLESDNTFSEFNIIGNAANEVTFTNSANTFTGVWNIQNGLLYGGEGLGQASGFIIGSTGVLNLDVDFVNSNATIAVSSGGSFVLDQDVTVSSVTVGGTHLEVDTYTGAELKAGPYGSTFDGSDDAATLTVVTGYVPPPLGITVTQIDDMPSTSDWNDPAYWSNGEAPASTNYYVNDNGGVSTNGWGTRTPKTGSGSFGGASLTLTNHAKLNIKSNGPWNIAEFNAWEGSILSSGGPATPEITGELNLKGTGSVYLDGQIPGRMTTLSSLITADTTITNIIVRMGQTAPTNTAEAMTAGFVITDELNTFDGVWVVEEGLLKGSGFDSGSFLITDMGFLDFDADYDNDSADLTIEANPTNTAQSGMILFDQNVTVGSATIHGTSLAVGEHTGATLKASYPNAFDDASSDTAILTVVTGNPVPPIGDIAGGFDGTNMVFGWQGSQLGTYYLQGREDLVYGSWTNVGDAIEGVNGPMSVEAPVVGPANFYRIIGE
ncbi:hypothetical protein P4E94_18800 [Pontiellaceae bacterium B12219]|nr:hypothetical protein [Pontiellaceae bacterium B12219]